MSPLLWILIITSLDGLLALTGAFSFLLSKKDLNKIILFLVAFATGTMLGGAFFHLIPEALEQLSIIKTALIFSLGFLMFYLIEKFLHWHHCHKTDCKTHPVSYLILYGDAVHNFIDGLLIAGSFIISIPIGIVTSISILAHELPQEIGDFGVLVYGGFTKKKALIYNFISQLTAILGGILGYYFLTLQAYSIILLPFAAGGFIYIATKDLIPEILKEKNKKRKLISLSFIALGLLILIAFKLTLH